MNIFHFVFVFCLTVVTVAIAEDASLKNTCEGAFESGENHLVTIPKFDPGDGNLRLFFMDFQSGYARILHEENGQLSAGPSLFSESPAELHVSCGPAVLEWQISDKKFSANRIAIRQQQVEMRSGNTGLKGTLYLPAGKPPYPALLLLHGSGKLTRYSFGPIPYFFSANGFAVLTYDKRGSGESEGNFDDADFQDFIEDGVAGISFLRSQKEIDASRIGLWGSSQGGFIAAGVASKVKGIRVLINQSGMFVPAWKQETYRVRSEMEANGYSSGEINLANDYLNAFFQAGKSGTETDWQKIVALKETLKEKEWFDLLPKVDTRDELISFWKKDYSFDPTSELQQVKCPVRAVFGSLDRSTPVNDTIENMKKALKDFDYVIIEKADHALLEAITGSDREIPALKSFAPAAFDVQKKWLLQLMAGSFTQ